MISVLLSDPRAAYLAQREEIDRAVMRVLERGRYILGPEVEQFEGEFAAYLGGGHGVGVANGTDAVALALRAVGVRCGDGVLTVSHTAVATIAAIRAMGGIPIYVDIDRQSMTLCPVSLRETVAWMNRHHPEVVLRAIVVVHLYGCPADMPRILEIAQECDLRVIEDCAQAHGASLAGRMLGRWGDVAAFSFYPTKNLGAMGDGGLVFSTDVRIAQTVQHLRQYGWRERYISEAEGVNSRLDEIQAAVLTVKLSRLDCDNRRRIEIARAYDSMTVQTALIHPWVPEDARHVYHQYVVRTEKREAWQRHFAECEIGTAVHYPLPVHRQPAYLGEALFRDLKVTEREAERVLSLPMHPHLTDHDVARVCAALGDGPTGY